MGGVMASRWHKLLWGSSLMGHNSHINQFPRFSARVALTFAWKVNFLECLLQSTGGHWLIGEPEESLIWHIASPLSGPNIGLPTKKNSMLFDMMQVLKGTIPQISTWMFTIATRITLCTSLKAQPFFTFLSPFDGLATRCLASAGRH